jgi:hypothetical protein
MVLYRRLRQSSKALQWKVVENVAGRNHENVHNLSRLKARGCAAGRVGWSVFCIVSERVICDSRCESTHTAPPETVTLWSPIPLQKVDLDHFKSWFKRFVTQFYELQDDGLQPVILKEQHTERTCREILFLARDQDLSEEDLLVAETAALFHDIGRFPQWKYYSTFIDSESVDHALLGLEVLSENGILLRISPDEREIIHEAVRHHNLRELPVSLSQRQLLFSRLLRDADKLDIWRVIVMQQREHNDLLETLAGRIPVGTTYSREIVGDLKRGKPGDFKYVRNRNDMRLVRLGWVFDLNFSASCRRALENRYIEEICSQLPANEEIEELQEYLISYLKRRSGAGS